MEHSSTKYGNVQTIPSIVRELQNLRCCDGDSVVLECQVDATSNPDIRWKKDGKPLSYGSDITSELDGCTARLCIKQIYPEDEGEYTCIAYNTLGKASTSACIIVDVPEEKENLLCQNLLRPSGLLSPSPTPRATPVRALSPARKLRRTKATPPKFYAIPHNRVAEEGETVRFQCSVVGHPDPWVTWDKDGRTVTPTPRIKLYEKDDRKVIEISEVTLDDAGLYRVTIENNMGKVEASARLDVIGQARSSSKGLRALSASPAPRMGPSFSRRVCTTTGRVGGRAMFACDIRGSPAPYVKWHKDNCPLERSEKYHPYWDGKTASLEVENLEMVDGGVYMCVAENEQGRAKCCGTLTVLDAADDSDVDVQPPKIIEHLPGVVESADGLSVQLEFLVKGTPPFDIIWLKDDCVLPDCDDFQQIDLGEGRFLLCLTDVFAEDSGVYKCEVYNIFGETNTKCNLIVQANEENLNAVLSRNEDSIPIKNSNDGNAASSPQSEEDKEVPDIAIYQSEDRRSILNESVTRCPRAEPLGDNMTQVPALVLSGPDDVCSHVGGQVMLTVKYIGTPEPQITWIKSGQQLCSDAHTKITTEPGMSSLLLQDITTDHSGKYVVTVENPTGQDCYYASVSVEGPPEPPSGKPTLSTTMSTTTIAWCSPPYDGGKMITGYVVEMHTRDSDTWQILTQDCHSLSYTVRDLQPGQYVFRVRAVNALGSSEPGAESESIFIDTSDELCSFEHRIVVPEPGQEFHSKYTVMEELGKGRYGTVHKILTKDSSQRLAAKFIRCRNSKDKDKVQDEIDIMNLLHHPKLMQLAAAFEGTREMIMVMEYISGGELFERVVADDFALTERDCILFLRQICEGVAYMHSMRVVHLDLKPENIMCHTRTSHQIKIIDFGLAQKLKDTPTRVLFGTPEFVPPEVINYEPIGVQSDLWSIGVITYVLLSGLSPFMGDNDAETFANITRAAYDFNDEAFDAVSEDARNFIESLLVKNMKHRLTAEQCLKHKWMTQHENLNTVVLSTDKLKKFIIRRKWQKTGNAIRAVGRMATLSASRRNSNASNSPGSPRPSLSNISKLISLNEENSRHIITSENINENLNKKISDLNISDTKSQPDINSDNSVLNISSESDLSYSEFTLNNDSKISEKNKINVSSDSDNTSVLNVSSESDVSFAEVTLNNDGESILENKNDLLSETDKESENNKINNNSIESGNLVFINKSTLSDTDHVNNMKDNININTQSEKNNFNSDNINNASSNSNINNKRLNEKNKNSLNQIRKPQSEINKFKTDYLKNISSESVHHKTITLHNDNKYTLNKDIKTQIGKSRIISDVTKKISCDSDSYNKKFNISNESKITLKQNVKNQSNKFNSDKISSDSDIKKPDESDKCIRNRVCSERSDSGISDCSVANSSLNVLRNKELSINEEKVFVTRKKNEDCKDKFKEKSTTNSAIKKASVTKPHADTVANTIRKFSSLENTVTKSTNQGFKSPVFPRTTLSTRRTLSCSPHRLQQKLTDNVSTNGQNKGNIVNKITTFDKKENVIKSDNKKERIKSPVPLRRSPIEKDLDTNSAFVKAAAFWNNVK